jgi:hypothetical protein
MAENGVDSLYTDFCYLLFPGLHSVVLFDCRVMRTRQEG